ncbi:MAG: tungstate ABC transporter substrate-binding protein WtpA [Lentimicrobium sp.]|jgi:molybdate/tungstate transport system substrate-binding protein|nr:tungstate ABC transporter substrate-binding protein WtpA [Lentimicrobium sp.]
MNNRLLLIPLLFSSALMLFSACSGNQNTADPDELNGELIIFHAGSLSVPFKALADSFNKIHPGVNILPESAGSLACIRKITDLNRPCDILASADYILIDKLMIPEHASWNLMFAGNEMALVYQPNSKFADVVNNKNWYSVLQYPEVRYGRSDPNSDPCGYRAILTMKLTEKLHHEPGLTENLMNRDQKYIRPKEVDLLALLETGTLDYIFLYKSVAIQHSLPFVELNDSINLSNPTLADWYSSVAVDVAGNKPGEKITQTGEAMIYGLTIPNNSEHPEIAKEFIRFLVGQGMTTIEKLGQTPLKPIYSPKSSANPELF